ncbi:dihydrofolate reductase family protein [Streptomyces sp. NPDC002067]
MRKIVLMMSVSLDGYFEGPGRDLGRHCVDDELRRHCNAYLATAGGFLDGRVTHELMAAHWSAAADPDAPAPVAEFAAIWRAAPKYVFSRTLEHVAPGTTLLREVDPDLIRALKSRPGGDLCLGGADLAATFFRHGLVDELRLYVHPVLLGAGTPLLPRAGARVPLRLVETHPFGNGVVLLRHQVLTGGGTE